MSDDLEARIRLRAPIHFVTQAGDATHAPLVLATIGASRTRLILDTGSDVHLITREVAEAAGLPLAALDAGTDHAGATMDSWTVGEVPLDLHEATGEPITLHDVVAIPAPDAFTRQGIGGGLSPQRLHASALTVIDEVADELLLIDADAAAIQAWLAARHPGRETLVLPRRPNNQLPIIQAAIEPHAPVPVLVNTGGRHTEFEPRTVPGRRVETIERLGTGVSGAPVMGGSAGPGILRIGATGLAVDSVMLREGMGDPPAMIGQDLLRGTVIVVGPDPATPIIWQLRAPAKTASAPPGGV